MWNSKQRPLLADDHLAQQHGNDNKHDSKTTMTTVNTTNTAVGSGGDQKHSKRKRFSQSFHKGYSPAISSPQSVPIHRNASNSQSLLNSSNNSPSQNTPINKNNNNYLSTAATPNAVTNRSNHSQSSNSHLRATMLLNLNASHSNDNERSVLSDGNENEQFSGNYDHSHDLLSSDNNAELDEFLDEELGFDVLDASHMRNHDSLTQESLDSEHVAKHRDPLSMPQSHNSNITGISHGHGTVSVIEDESQLSAMLPGGAHFQQRMKLRNDRGATISNTQQSLPIIPTDQSPRYLNQQQQLTYGSNNNTNNRASSQRKRYHSKGIKIGGKLNKKKGRSETTYVPSQSLQKTAKFEDQKQSHSLQGLFALIFFVLFCTCIYYYCYYCSYFTANLRICVDNVCYI